MFRRPREEHRTAKDGRVSASPLHVRAQQSAPDVAAGKQRPPIAFIRIFGVPRVVIARYTEQRRTAACQRLRCACVANVSPSQVSNLLQCLRKLTPLQEPAIVRYMHTTITQRELTKSNMLVAADTLDSILMG
ncbi:hypothetical protein NDU88_004792 [Pleurodeles waltl]|uniref:Uncharacterized protein n=1 Tax=Pleurodeles waltl TaxID=8319 RepID=A0AAV7RMA2_PLEWA|nr:hypothetical protein NDU88_004792 [Pleurodeles waltl]